MRKEFINAKEETMNNQEREGPDGPKKTTAKAVYISFGKEEHVRLQGADPRLLRMYYELKWLANFKTGLVGSFGKQKLTYEYLAQRVQIPTRQGSQATHIDGKEVARLIQRLETLGLVEGAKIEDGRLTMKLPLSPITQQSTGKEAKVEGKVSATQVKPGSSGCEASTSVDGQSENAQQGDELATEEWDDWGEDFVAGNALEIQVSNAPTGAPKEPLSSLDEAFPLDAEFADLCTATRGAQAPKMPEKLPRDAGVRSAQNPHESRVSGTSDAHRSVLTSRTTDSTNVQYPCSVPDPEAPSELGASKNTISTACFLTPAEIERHLKTVGFEIKYLDHQVSRAIYKEMSAMKVLPWQLEQALDKVREESEKTPKSVMDCLRRIQQKYRERVANGHSGRVAL